MHVNSNVCNVLRMRQSMRFVGATAAIVALVKHRESICNRQSWLTFDV